MSLRMQHHSRPFSTGEIASLIRAGSMALPDFQRDFVWQPEQVVELLYSATNGWPIGSLLVLEGPQDFEVRNIAAGPSVARDSVKHILLDGQQRATALFQALLDLGDYVYYTGEPLDDKFSDSEIRWISRSKWPLDRQPGAQWKISELITSSDFLQSTANLNGTDLRSAIEMRQRVAGSLIDDAYTVPAIVMNPDIELEALTKIFETVNRTGVNLDAFDLMVAVAYPHGLNLRADWDYALSQRPVFGEFAAKGIEVLKLIALWNRSEPGNRRARQVSGVRQKDVLALDPHDVIEGWPRALDAYQNALEFAKRMGVRDSASLPPKAMMLTLAYLLNARKSDGRIERWYWNAIARQSYAQGANTRVLTEIDNFDDARLWDTDYSLALAATALDEPVTRNRILRSGLRSLAALNLGQFRDESPVRDFPVEPILKEGRTIANSRDRLGDLWFTKEGKLSEVRRAIRRNESSAAVLDLVEPETDREIRVSTFLRWIGDRL